MSDPTAASMPETIVRPRPVPLRRNAGFQTLWIGQLLSDTGSQIGLIAYPLLILALTRSPVLAGVVGTAREIALICVQLPPGAVSDRFDRRLTMIACDTVRAAPLVLLAILIAVHLASWPVVLVVSLIEGAVGGLFDPSATAALAAIVSKEQLVQAWAPPRAGPAPPTWPAPRSAGYCSALAGPSRSWPMLSPTRSRSAR